MVLSQPFGRGVGSLHVHVLEEEALEDLARQVMVPKD
jgi:hypothetical protein